MKRKTFDLRQWSWAVSGQQSTLTLPGGVIVDFQAAQARSALHKPFLGRSLRIFDTGWRWVRYAPLPSPCAVTLMLDGAGTLQQIYVDIGQSSGVDETTGLPWIDDLYLDVIAVTALTPQGHWQVTESEIIDQDELESALKRGQVTGEQYALAWAEARRIQAELHAGTFAPLSVLRGYLHDPYT